MSSSTEGSAVPASAKGSWSSFLKSIASFNGDLSSLTAPAFILSSTSLVEFSTYWAEHPSIFIAPAAEKDPAKRALLVLKWFLSTLKQQYSTRNEKLGSEKKPLNPFLGELFLGRWVDGAGETQLVSEQVSHHPPVTAYCIWNSEHGVRLQGYNGQKASFSSMTINVKQIGHAILHIDEFDEDYLITLPPLHIEGLYSGAPFVELNGDTYITSTSGYTSRIKYSGRGWVSGKKNSFNASLYHDGKEKEPLYTVDGQWTGSFSIKDTKTKATLDTYDAAKSKTTSLTIAPVDEQDPLESRRAWQKVAAAIQKGDMDATSREKTVIEQSQRELRNKEKAEGKEWNRRFFVKTDSHATLEKLAKKLGVSVDGDKTNGVWTFSSEKASVAK
ncbi:oxysterol binding protein-like protein [Pseudovirgaria hyperparasitica]|uniref:Oxysterol binding protein-like protein n=1 Tax=Pseudovirgaria hyperparasitica TaxID=470096 RepID=A0A6A6WFC2_9PEZI|nr:oxysterol binding protein-like protein [Pseudovirgaria hyperparasitica]KAF2761423.1 oxysterol binding protein-like protein [Pseudovirgaria hyperparasitica]